MTSHQEPRGDSFIKKDGSNMCPLHGNAPARHAFMGCTCSSGHTPGKGEYERHHSHSHCWEQGGAPGCGQSLENHKQCCLCDTPYPQEPQPVGEWEREFDRRWNNNATELLATVVPYSEDSEYAVVVDDVKDFIRKLLSSDRERVRAAEAAKNEAYKERDMLVCALSKVFPAYLARHDENDKDWEDDWRWIVYIEIPVRELVVFGDQINTLKNLEDRWQVVNKQVSWHIHDSEREMFNHLEVRENNWDGHNTQRKYERLNALSLLTTPQQ